MAPDGRSTSIAPSLSRIERGIGTPSLPVTGDGLEIPPSPQNREPTDKANPTVLPDTMLKQFHFAFLIRHPRCSIPSYFRCTVPPLDAMTGFHDFLPSEAGYRELRQFFDYLRASGHVGPHLAGGSSGPSSKNAADGSVTATPEEICVIDADDLLDDPAGIVKAFCNSVGLVFNASMLSWSTKKDYEIAVDAFQKWKGFHEDAIKSTGLQPRKNVSTELSLNITRSVIDLVATA